MCLRVGRMPNELSLELHRLCLSLSTGNFTVLELKLLPTKDNILNKISGIWRTIFSNRIQYLKKCNTSYILHTYINEEYCNTPPNTALLKILQVFSANIFTITHSLHNNTHPLIHTTHTLPRTYIQTINKYLIFYNYNNSYKIYFITTFFFKCWSKNYIS